MNICLEARRTSMPMILAQAAVAFHELGRQADRIGAFGLDLLDEANQLMLIGDDFASIY